VPSLLLDRVEKSSHHGYKHALRRSLKKTEIDLKKTRQIRLSEEDERRRKCTFVTAGTRQIQLGGHIGQDLTPSPTTCHARSD
jgi:hypothetical protein